MIFLLVAAFFNGRRSDGFLRLDVGFDEGIGA
jgi:hypothetical protein